MSALVAVLLANAVLVLPLAVAAWATMRFLRRPAIAHALWVLALIKLLTPPLVAPELIVDPYRWPTLASMLPHAPSQEPRSTRAIHHSVSESSPDNLVAETSSTALVEPTTTRRLHTVVPRSGATLAGKIFLVVWAVGTLGCFFLFARRIRLVARLIRTCGRRDAMASALAESLYGESLRTPPRVILVDAVISPTLIGVGPWTKILYPRRLWDELPAGQRDGLLLHELEHFRRGDHWVRILEAAATASFWWHPVIWWARHHIELTEESCCDAVAARQSDDVSYAEALLTTLDFINEPAWSASVPVGTGVSRLPILEQRLTQIIHPSFAGQLSAWTRIALAGFAAVMLPIQPLLFGGRVVSASAILPSNPSPAVGVTPIENVIASETTQSISIADLPPEPQGWWSPQPPKSWAHISGDVPGAAQLIVSADGTVLLRGGMVDGTIDLSSHQITAAAFWKSSTRLVTGDAKGQIRLWDVASGEPVSLLGLHRTPVTSLAISPNGTLITGAQDGSLFLWNLQSGGANANWTTNERPIQSVRLVDGGRRAVVIASDWRSDPSSSRVVVLDVENLEPIFDWVTDQNLATTRYDQKELTFVDWSGNLLRLNGQGALEAIGTTEKDVVSAFVFSQDAVRS